MSWIITMVAVMMMSFVYIIIKGGDEGTPQ